MGIRFQKRIPLIPGIVYLNLSKSGVSLSLGGHGASVNLGTQRRTVNVGIPGTGLSYRTPLTGALIGAIVVVAAVIALVWYLNPELIRPVLHKWAPRYF